MRTWKHELYRLGDLAFLLALCGVAQPAFAHHSFGVYFDADKPVTLSGVVTKVDWRNPHTHLYIDVTDESSKVVNWTLEGYPPNVLARTGWKKDVTVKIGDTISIFGWRARDGSPAAHLREATLAKETELNHMSSERTDLPRAEASAGRQVGPSGHHRNNVKNAS